MLDANGANPVRCKIVRITDTGGVIADDTRGVRYFTPTRDRIVIPDLFHPVGW